MPKLTFSVVTGLIVVLLFLCADFLVGEFHDTAIIRNSSKNFRSESSKILLSSKVLIPNSNHLYSRSIHGVNKLNLNIKKLRSFTTNSSGEVQGPTSFTSKNNIRIVFMGGSTTECNEVDSEYRFPYLVGKQLTLLHKNLSFSGINIAVRGNTVHDSINLLLNHKSIINSDIVVLMHNINDRFFLNETGQYETINHVPGPTQWASVIYNIDMLSRSIWSFIVYRSNILFIINERFFSINPWTGEKDKIAPIRNILGNDKIKSNPYQALSVFKENLKLFITISKTKGITPIIMTQALEFESVEQDLFNQAIRSVTNETKTLIVDIAKELNAKEKGLFLGDGIHLNNKGSKTISTLISNTINTNY